MSERMLTPKEYAELKQVKVATVWGWIRQGLLKAEPVGKRLYRIQPNAKTKRDMK